MNHLQIPEEIKIELNNNEYGYNYFGEFYLDNTLCKIDDITPYDQLVNFIHKNTKKRFQLIVSNKNLKSHEILNFILKFNLNSILEEYIKLYEQFIVQKLTNIYHQFLVGKMGISKNINLIQPFIKNKNICYDIRSVIVSFM